MALLNGKKQEWGFDGDIIEAQLAHTEQNAVRDAYNHASYLEKRRGQGKITQDITI